MYNRASFKSIGALHITFAFFVLKSIDFFFGSGPYKNVKHITEGRMAYLESIIFQISIGPISLI